MIGNQASKWMDPDFHPHEPWAADRVSLIEYLDMAGAPSDVTKDIEDIEILPAKLPDEPEFYNVHLEDNELNIPPSAMEFDAIITPDPEDPDAEQFVIATLLNALRKPVQSKLVYMYNSFCQMKVMDYHDFLGAQIAALDEHEVAGLINMAQWLVTSAPDRQPVKLGLMILSYYPAIEDDEIFETLGRHEEFAPYALLWLDGLYATEQITFDVYRERVLGLYQKLSGHGRAFIIEMIGRDEDTRKQNLPGELFRIGPAMGPARDESSFLLASYVDILALLKGEDVNREDILSSLHVMKNLIFADQEEAEIFDVPNSLDSLETLFAHLARETEYDLTRIFLIEQIYQYIHDCVSDKSAWGTLQQLGWDITRLKALREVIAGIREKHMPAWHETVKDYYDTQGQYLADIVGHIGGRIGLISDEDYWQWHYERLARGNRGLFSSAMHLAGDEAEFQKALDAGWKLHAPDQTWSPDNDRTGPDDYLRFAALIEAVSRLGDTGVADERYLLAGLKAPYKALRYETVNTLAVLPRTSWSGDIRATLETMAFSEPEEELKQAISDLLRNKGDKGSVHGRPSRV